MAYNQILFDDLGVLKSVNEHKKTLKQFKMRAFYLYHHCKLNCVQNINNENTDNCFRMCESGQKIDYVDEYFTYKKQIKFPKDVFYALPRYEKDASKKYVIPESESYEYQKKCLKFEQDSSSMIRALKKYLDDRQTKYIPQKK